MEKARVLNALLASVFTAEVCSQLASVDVSGNYQTEEYQIMGCLSKPNVYSSMEQDKAYQSMLASIIIRTLLIIFKRLC